MTILEKLKRFVPVVLIVGLVFGLLLAFSLPAVLGTDFAQTQIRQQINKLFPAGLEIGGIGLNYFPWPHLQVRGLDIRHKISALQDVSISAQTLEVYPHLLKILFKKIELSQLYARGGEIRYHFKWPQSNTASELPLEDVRLSAKDVRGPRRLDGKLECRLFGVQKNAKLRLAYDATADRAWIPESTLNGELSLKEVDLKKAQSALFPNGEVYLTGGLLDLEWKATKAREESAILSEIRFAVKNLSLKEFGVGSGEQTIEWIKGEIEATIDLSTKILIIKDFNLESSLGDATIRGKFDFSKDFKQDGIDIEISFPQINLDSWKAALPPELISQLQFGGAARLNVLLRGGLDKLGIKLESNFSDCLIQVPTLFEKPQGKDMALGGQFNLENGSKVSGDFEMRLLDLVAKGTVLEYRPATSEYEVTFLTNKFSLSDLPSVAVPLRSYFMSGAVKWLVNVRGNMEKKTFRHFRTHVDAEDVSLSGSDGPIVSQLSTSIDYQENDLSVENFRCMWGGQPVLGSFKSVGPAPTSFTFVLQPGNGMIQGKGVLDHALGQYVLTSDVLAENVPLAQVLPPLMQGKNYLEGSASAESLIKARGRSIDELLNSLQSNGKVQIVNGKFNTLDIMGALGAVRKLVALAAESRGVTQFLSAQAEYESSGTNVLLKNGYLRSERFDAEFGGEVSPENINVELYILLSHALSKRLVPNLGVDQILKLPARVSGSVAEPEISVARNVLDAAFGALVHNFTRGIFGKSILGEESPVPQDLIVQRGTDQPGAPSGAPLGTPSGAPSTTPPDSQTQPAGAAPDQNAPPTDESTPQEATVEEQLVQTGLEMFSGLLGGGSRSQNSN